RPVKDRRAVSQGVRVLHDDDVGLRSRGPRAPLETWELVALILSVLEWDVAHLLERGRRHGELRAPLGRRIRQRELSDSNFGVLRRGGLRGERGAGEGRENDGTQDCSHRWSSSAPIGAAMFVAK